MNAQEEFIYYLQKHPECYVIMKSKVHIGVLGLLEKKPLTIESLKLEIKGTEINDVELILDSLTEINVAQRFLAGQKYLYSLTGHGKTFLEKYRKTKKDMLG